MTDDKLPEPGPEALLLLGVMVGMAIAAVILHYAP
jgi:hypothetical protein